MNTKVLSIAEAGSARPISPRLQNPRNMILKRAFDVVAASLLIVLFLPVMAVVAAAIIVQDGTPVFFGHRRIGRGGKTFRCWKFRTMIRDADRVLARLLEENPSIRNEWELTQKLREDPRIIPGIGHFLRRSSLDELPQLFNVLKGEMSMVGPRPVVADELKRYGVFRAHYISVRPGLTGPWQIGDRSDDDYDGRVSKDVAYIENADFATDLQIVFSTARVVVQPKGAY